MLKRTVLHTSTLVVVAAAVFAACSDNAGVAPRPGIAKPLFSDINPFNNDGQCMYEDAVRAPTGTIAGVKFGDDPASAANCSSNDVNIATAELKFFAIADENDVFGPPIAYTGQPVTCLEGRRIQLTMAAKLDETASSQRYDIGIWLATDGGTAKIGACKHYNLLPGGGVTDEDGDVCGDLNNKASVSNFELGTFTSVCGVNPNPNAPPSNSLHVGSCIGWTEPGGANRTCPTSASGADGYRFGTLYGNQAKCNCDGFDVPITVLKTAKLEVTKTCSPVNDNGTFDLLIDGSTTVNGSVVGNDKTCGTGTGAQSLGAGTSINPGAVHSFGEGDFTAANYTSSYACTNRLATGPQHAFTASGDAAATGSSLGPNQITLLPGEDVICAYTNERKASLTIVKDAVPNDLQDFAFTTSGAGLSDFSLDDDAGVAGGDNTLLSSKPFTGLVPGGARTVTETAVEGWTLTNIQCTGATNSTVVTGASGGFDPGDNSVTVTLAAGENVSCTFTNTKKGSITIVKDAQPNSLQDFGFTTSGAGLSNFTLDDDAGVTGGDDTQLDTKAFTGLQPSQTARVITESSQTEWVLTNIVCTGYTNSTVVTGASGGFDAGDNSVSITLAAGENVTCTFTNQRKARLTVTKAIIGGGSQLFDFVRGAVSFTLGNGGSVSTGFTLTPATYRVCENSLAVAWHAIATLDGSSIVLINPNATDQPPQDLGTRCFDVVINYGDDRTIAFVNSQPPTGGDARTIGYWKNWSSCTGGKQYIKALERGIWNKTLDGNLPQTLGSSLTLAGAPGPNQPAVGCADAVNILDKRDLGGTKRASDPAYNMAAQLLAAILNRHAGAAAVCNIDQLIADAQALLVQIGFTGTGASSLSGKNADKTLVAKANNFATLLDAYNNNNCTNYVP